MQLCPNCGRKVSSAALALTGVGFRASCQSCGSRLSVAIHWQHALAFLAVTSFAFCAALSISQRSYAWLLLSPAALALGCIVVSSVSPPQLHRPRQSALAWVGLVVLFCAMAVAFSGVPN